MGIFYNYCKLKTRLTSHLFYNNIRVSGQENIPTDNSVLLALTHPNSFLDAILVGGMIKRPTYFLARGDAFRNKLALPILHSLNMLPVYRLSEGKENLGKNTETFDACQNILSQRKVVIIFAEGLSENNWELRAMKKGPARIAKKAWSSDSDSKEMVVVPVGLTYEHYRGAGKNILINIGKPIGKNQFNEEDNEAMFVRKFNEKITQELGVLAYINPALKEGTPAYTNFRGVFQKEIQQQQPVQKIIDALHTHNGEGLKVRENNFIVYSLLFLPLYKMVYWLSPKIVKQSIFFDSICFGLFMLLWPVYLVLIGLLLGLLF